MVPLIISREGSIHMDTVRRRKDFATDINVDLVRMAQDVLRYNVVIVGKFFNKGSWVSEAWKKDHPEEFDGETDGLQERMATANERTQLLNLDPVHEGSVCAVSGTQPPRNVLPTSAGRGNPN